MSRQRPRGLQEGSRRWWQHSMKRWSEQIGRDVPRNMRRRRRVGYERPAWSRASQPYAMTLAQWDMVAAAHKKAHQTAPEANLTEEGGSLV